MAKKPSKGNEAVQVERFRKAVRDMVDTGELNPTEADEALDKIVSLSRQERD